jgi:acyl-CoA reductase-like NAD-dependent aldehyde dehydrogenase
MNDRRLPPDLPYWLAGEAVAAAPWLEVEDKYTRQPATRVARADAAVVDRAIGAAVLGFDAFRRWPAWRRAAVLRHLARRIDERQAELARVLVIETGKPLAIARGEVLRAFDTVSLAAEEATRIHGEQLPLDGSPRGEGFEGLVRRFGVGPCAFITPFNFPLNLVCHKVAPALAAGCSFVLKPASTTPVSALLIGEILAETDLPPGTFSILPCASRDAAALVDDPRLRLLSFTGSAAVGWELAARAVRKRVTLELGGNAACIVDAGTDLDHAAERIVYGAFYQAGQSCISVQRVFVHRDALPALREKLVARVQASRSGDPLEEGTFVAPLISVEDAVRVEGWVQAALDRGAKLVCGGARDGAVFDLTILEDVPADAEVSCQEVFGPVMTLESFTDFGDALRRANDTRFGLQAGVFTDSLSHAWQAFETLEVGGVVIGDVPASRVDAMPYGGVKESGHGREGVRYAIQEMTEPRLMLLRRQR